MKVLLADNHEILRQGLRSLLESTGKYQVIGEAENGRQVIEMTRLLKPELIIMDFSMPGVDGISATNIIKDNFPEIKILILSMYADSYFVQQAMKLGASGFLLKENAFDEILEALVTIKENKPFLCSGVLRPVIHSHIVSSININTPHLKDLSKDERKILLYILKGYSHEKIAQEIHTETSVVKEHIKSVKEKLKTKKDIDLISYAKVLDNYSY